MKNKGFTLTEIIISVTILASIGLLITLGLNKIFDESNKEEKITFEDKVLASADLYLLNNDNIIKDLQTTKGFVYMTVKDLIISGFLEENIIDPETNEPVDQSRVVKVLLDADGFYYLELDPEYITEPYLEGQTLNLAYKQNYNCKEISDQEWGTQFLRVIDENGFKMDVSKDVIKDIHCDVDTSKPGKYTIEYVYQISEKYQVKSYFRTVIVNRDLDDIVSITAEAKLVKSNPIKNCAPSNYLTIFDNFDSQEKKNDMQFLQTTLANQNEDPIFIINDDIRFEVTGVTLAGEEKLLNSTLYVIEGNYSTSTQGNRNVTITYTGENSDGKSPSTTSGFNVTYSPDDIISIRIKNAESKYIINSEIDIKIEGTKRSGGTREIHPCEYTIGGRDGLTTKTVGDKKATFEYKSEYNTEKNLSPTANFNYEVVYDPLDVMSLSVTGIVKNKYYCQRSTLSPKVTGTRRDGKKVSRLSYSSTGGSTTSLGTNYFKATYSGTNSYVSKPSV